MNEPLQWLQQAVAASPCLPVSDPGHSPSPWRNSAQLSTHVLSAAPVMQLPLVRQKLSQARHKSLTALYWQRGS